jgi:hypothetical protein
VLINLRLWAAPELVRDLVVVNESCDRDVNISCGCPGFDFFDWARRRLLVVVPPGLCTAAYVFHNRLCVTRLGERSETGSMMPFARPRFNGPDFEALAF